MSEFQATRAIDDIDNIALDTSKTTQLVIQWKIMSVSSDAELSALRHLTEKKRIGERQPSERSRMAFDMILDFKGAERIEQNLHHEFPHLKDPWREGSRLNRVLLSKMSSFNVDHRRAFESLSSIPNGLMFLNGCPGTFQYISTLVYDTSNHALGAGKTEFNMVLAALIQSRRDMSNKRHSPVLFLVDINKTVDDAANRYFRLCREAGLGSLRIIRMHGFPYEMRKSQKLQQVSSKADDSTIITTDFTKRFLTTASLVKTNLAATEGSESRGGKAPTLDEAAWQYFESHKSADVFAGLQKLLTWMQTEGALPSADWKSLRERVKTLYVAVLSQADFIATTPVAAASGQFASLFRPKVIIIDEAPHARELTTLIAIAYYNPKLWMFTGDVRQTEPFVKGGSKMDMEKRGLKHNPYHDQLKLSTMARAAHVGALSAQLLINNRAHGNLHRLPSDLFYDGQMRSSYTTPETMYPKGTAYLKDYLANIGGISYPLRENRIIVHLAEASERRLKSSFWNPQHHEWVLKQARQLLHDGKFLSLKPDRKGTIMIATPYKSAAGEYQAAIKRWPEEWRDRVEILTVDKSQGNQADVVILDMVRTSTVGFMDNPQRLNVAVTRALQAEIIVMNEKMTTRPFRGMRIKTTYTSKLWEDTLYAGRLFEFHGNQVQAQYGLIPRHLNLATAPVGVAPILPRKTLA